MPYAVAKFLLTHQVKKLTKNSNEILNVTNDFNNFRAKYESCHPFNIWTNCLFDYFVYWQRSISNELKISVISPIVKAGDREITWIIFNQFVSLVSLKKYFSLFYKTELLTLWNYNCLLFWHSKSSWGETVLFRKICRRVKSLWRSVYSLNYIIMG